MLRCRSFYLYLRVAYMSDDDIILAVCFQSRQITLLTYSIFFASLLLVVAKSYSFCISLQSGPSDLCCGSTFVGHRRPQRLCRPDKSPIRLTMIMVPSTGMLTEKWGWMFTGHAG